MNGGPCSTNMLSYHMGSSPWVSHESCARFVHAVIQFLINSLKTCRAKNDFGTHTQRALFHHSSPDVPRAKGQARGVTKQDTRAQWMIVQLQADIDISKQVYDIYIYKYEYVMIAYYLHLFTGLLVY